MSGGLKTLLIDCHGCQTEGVLAAEAGIAAGVATASGLRRASGVDGRGGVGAAGVARAERVASEAAGVVGWLGASARLTNGAAGATQ